MKLHQHLPKTCHCQARDLMELQGGNVRSYVDSVQHGFPVMISPTNDHQKQKFDEDKEGQDDGVLVQHPVHRVRDLNRLEQRPDPKQENGQGQDVLDKDDADGDRVVCHRLAVFHGYVWYKSEQYFKS